MRHDAEVPAPSPALRSAAFFLVGPGLEAGVGPALVTGGFARGDGVLDTPAVTLAGAMLLALGIAAVLWCYSRFVAGAGTPSPLAPPRALVGGGPYAIVRNPMYVATATCIAAEGLLVARPILLVAAAVYLGAMALLVRRVEEPLLARRFGPAWDAYAAAVPGWLPAPGRR
ncbi:MAG: isoprenylcysteine carboxylmethyltransferase family protein [Solirubrobacterales bacterium]|jgi:protein-S-isoprenylcysteine O-methyltransferase Ste14|nr:isoprenylcysteine carboxylmethyltransferase family protein [Solirubrobacterales bacterium]